MQADPSKGALSPAMAAAAAVAAAGRAGRVPPTAVSADWPPSRITPLPGTPPPAAVAPETTAGVVVEIPPWTTSLTRLSPVALRPASMWITKTVDGQHTKEKLNTLHLLCQRWSGIS